MVPGRRGIYTLLRKTTAIHEIYCAIHVMWSNNRHNNENLFENLKTRKPLHWTGWRATMMRETRKIRKSYTLHDRFSGRFEKNQKLKNNWLGYKCFDGLVFVCFDKIAKTLKNQMTALMSITIQCVKRWNRWTNHNRAAYGFQRFSFVNETFRLALAKSSFCRTTRFGSVRCCCWCVFFIVWIKCTPLTEKFELYISVGICLWAGAA